MDVDSGESLANPNTTAMIGWNLRKVDESSTIETVERGVKRFLTILDQLDTNVEILRREARGLQDKKDSLLMSMDVMKNNELYELDESLLMGHVGRFILLETKVKCFVNLSTTMDMIISNCSNIYTYLIFSISYV